MFLAGHRNIKVCTGEGRGFDFLFNISPVHPCCDHSHYSMHITKQKSSRHLWLPLLPPSAPFRLTLCFLLPSTPPETLTSVHYLFCSLCSQNSPRAASVHSDGSENRGVPHMVRDGAQEAGAEQADIRNSIFLFKESLLGLTSE